MCTKTLFCFRILTNALSILDIVETVEPAYSLMLSLAIVHLDIKGIGVRMLLWRNGALVSPALSTAPVQLSEKMSPVYVHLDTVVHLKLVAAL